MDPAEFGAKAGVELRKYQRQIREVMELVRTVHKLHNTKAPGKSSAARGASGDPHRVPFTALEKSDLSKAWEGPKQVKLHTHFGGDWEACGLAHRGWRNKDPKVTDLATLKPQSACLEPASYQRLPLGGGADVKLQMEIRKPWM